MITEGPPFWAGPCSRKTARSRKTAYNQLYHLLFSPNVGQICKYIQMFGGEGGHLDVLADLASSSYHRGFGQFCIIFEM